MGNLIKILALALFLGACGQQYDLNVLQTQLQVDTFSGVNNSGKKTDILFVVDNSGSMKDEQQHVADSFDSFISAFVNLNNDFHIAVISTDALDDAGAVDDYWTNTYKPFTDASSGIIPRPGRFLSKSPNRFLTSQMAKSDIVSQFSANASLGTNGNGSETGLYSVIKALDPTQIAAGGYNAGFVRDDALLNIIIVSDEDESLDPNWDVSHQNQDEPYLRDFRYSSQAKYNDRLNAFTSTVVGAKHGDRSQVRVDAIVAPSKDLCPSLGSEAGVAGVGETYMKVVSDFQQGRVLNICSDFSKSLGQLGYDIIVKRNFMLKFIPNTVQGIEVKLDGTTLSQSDQEGWTYDSASNEIILHGLGLDTRTTNYRLEVSYKYTPGVDN